MKNLNFNQEQWKSCASIGYPIYEVSTYGRVRNRLTSAILSTKPSKNGYVMYSLHNKSIDKSSKTFVINAGRLVLSIFNPVENMQSLEADHIDRNPLNNNLYNLRWVTKVDNLQNRGLSHPRGNYNKGFYLLFDDGTFKYYRIRKECDIMPYITLASLLKDGHYSKKFKCRAYYVGKVPSQFEYYFDGVKKLY